MQYGRIASNGRLISSRTEVVKETAPWGGQDSAAVGYDEHLSIAADLSDRQGEEPARLDLFPDGESGQNGHTHAADNRFLDGLIAPEFEYDMQVRK